MTDAVVVLGAGYAGAGAIQRLEEELDDARLVWISNTDYHLVLHESHRLIRDPSVQHDITIPIEDIKSNRTEFLEGTVVTVDTDDRHVELADGRIVDYDFVLVALGSETAFYGIPGLESHSFTLNGRDDAIDIHEAVLTAAKSATVQRPARVVVGGAGLSGVQVAGELAGLRDDRGLPIDVAVVEALPTILPGLDPELQAAVRSRLDDRDVTIITDRPIVEATADSIEFADDETLDVDVLIWTGGVTGRDALEDANVEREHNRVLADARFTTSDDRVFAIGDSAVIDLDTDVAPPTAQAAWQASSVAAGNIAATIEGSPLREWSYRDKGTLVSVGHDAVASGVVGIPIGTFGSLPARFLKKFVAARWIADLTTWRRAIRAWGGL